MKNEELKLLEQYLDGTLIEEDVPRLRKLLLESSEARSTLRTLATLDLGLHDFAATQDYGRETKLVPPGRTTSRSFGGSWTNSLLTLASLAIVGLGTALWFQMGDSNNSPSANLNVATVTGIGGEILWTGNGGQVTNELEVGQSLTGGTIEGVSPRSWVELEFLDGSRVTVAGDSRLTFSDFDQKILYLKEGSIASSVKPQNPESPMLVYTRNAMLEVLGTEFEVESNVETTSLDVTEGKVRFKRISDGQTVEVPANQRVQSSEGLKLSSYPIPNRTRQWKSNLNQPDGTRGKWLPGTESLPPRLKLVHYWHKPRKGEPLLIKSASMKVLGEDDERIVLQAGSKIRVRGYAKSNQKAVFGVVAQTDNGDFGGYYASSQPNGYWMDLQTNEVRTVGGLQSFEVMIDANDFCLDADLDQRNFATTPIGMVADVFVCAAPAENSDLEISEVEIFQPDTD